LIVVIGRSALSLEVAALTEGKPAEARVRPHSERLGGVAGVLLVGSFERVEHGERAGLAAADRVAHRFADLRLPGGWGGGEQLDEVGAGDVLADRGRRDSERVEHAAEALLARDLDQLDASFELGDALQVVVWLGVDVDHERAAPLGLVGEQLGGDRLAGAERPGQQDRWGASAPGGLGDVELDRPPTTGDRLAEVGALLGAGVDRAERHQRAELLDRQDLPVVRHGAATGAWQMVEEERWLQAGGAVERDRAVVIFERRDAPLELGARLSADGERDGGFE
jgi:hypothetical protein